MTDDTGIRSVRRLARELAREPSPELDWDRLEGELMGALPMAGQSLPVPLRRSRVWTVPAAAALAVAAAAAVFIGTRPSTEQHVAASQAAEAATRTPTGAVNGDALGAGAIVVATTEPVTVEHAGQASWTLEPRSRAHVIERGRLLTIALENGAVAVRVVPHSGSEPFAVEVGMTRVAAHGTQFRVERVAGALHVDVSEGTVAVGATRDRGHTHGFTLPAPSRGAFGLDGTTGTVWSASGAAVSDTSRSAENRPVLAGRSSQPAPSGVRLDAPRRTPVAPPSGVPRTLERVPTIAEIDDGLNAFQAASNQCFAAHAPASTDLKVTVHVMAIIDIQASGQIRNVFFEPPLAPAVQGCVEEQLGTVKFASSRDGVKIERTLEFVR
jgi:hypothetical protein